MSLRMKYSAAVIATGILVGGIGINGQVVEASTSKSIVNVATHNQKAVKTEVVLEWNGQGLSQKGILDHGTTYVPANALKDILGGSLKYDAKTKTYHFGKGYNQLSAVVYDANEIALMVNGYYVGEPGGKIVNGHLYIPYKVLNEYMGIQGSWNPSAKLLSMKAKKQNSIDITTATLKKDMAKVTAKVNYPVIRGMQNEESQTNINKVLKKNAEEVMAAFEENASELPASSKKFPYEFQGDFVIHRNAEGLLSITTYNYSFTGGAHGMTYRKSFTFSLENGKQMKLGEFINLQGKNKQKLNDLVLTTMKKDGGYLGGFKGVPADAEFYVNDHAAVLYFQLYDYTAYAYGFPEFELKFKDWK